MCINIKWMGDTNIKKMKSKSQPEIFVHAELQIMMEALIITTSMFCIFKMSSVSYTHINSF